MASSGPLGPATAADDATVGTITWSNTGNITAEDAAVAGTSSSLGSGVVSHYLKATNFGFAIPTGATIDGIVVEIKKQRGGTHTIVDNAVKIVKGGTIGTTNKASAAAWIVGTLTYSTYGTSTDLWGETWAASDINATTFGVVISCKGSVGGKGGGSPTVDYIRITVYYTAAATNNALFFGADF